jgi:hypothetical protein
MLVTKRYRYDLGGKRFGKWLVRPVSESRAGAGVYWQCQCDCGTVRFVRSTELLRGNSLSCGCGRNKPDKPKQVVREKTVTVEYRYYNRSRKRFDGWDYFGRLTVPNAQTLITKGGKGLQYRIKGTSTPEPSDDLETVLD